QQGSDGGDLGIELAPQHIRFRGEVAEERAPADPRLGGDLLDGGFLEPLCREQAQRDEFQLAAAGAGRAAAAPTPGCRRSHAHRPVPLSPDSIPAGQLLACPYSAHCDEYRPDRRHQGGTMTDNATVELADEAAVTDPGDDVAADGLADDVLVEEVS